MMFVMIIIFFFKQKTAYEVRISDWSSDVCSSDLFGWRGDRGQSAFVRGQYLVDPQAHARAVRKSRRGPDRRRRLCFVVSRHLERDDAGKGKSLDALAAWNCPVRDPDRARRMPGGHRAGRRPVVRSEEHTSELQSIMR